MVNNIVRKRISPEPGPPAPTHLSFLTIDFLRFEFHFSCSGWVLRIDSISGYVWYGGYELIQTWQRGSFEGVALLLLMRKEIFHFSSRECIPPKHPFLQLDHLDCFRLIAPESYRNKKLVFRAAFNRVCDFLPSSRGKIKGEKSRP